MSVRIVKENNNNKIIRKLENGNEVHELYEGSYNDGKDALPLEEHIKLEVSTGWNFETLTEELLDYIPEWAIVREAKVPGKTLKKNIEEGDIIYVTNFISPTTGKKSDLGHRFFIVNKIITQEGKPNRYEGYELQTSDKNPKKRANVFNKDKDHYANNIYISNYGSILFRGPKDINKDFYIDVKNKCWFDDLGITDDGYWKGNTTYEFRRFMQRCIDNANKNDIEANKEMQWPTNK